MGMYNVYVMSTCVLCMRLTPICFSMISLGTMQYDITSHCANCSRLETYLKAACRNPAGSSVERGGPGSQDRRLRRVPSGGAAAALGNRVGSRCPACALLDRFGSTYVCLRCMNIPLYYCTTLIRACNSMNTQSVTEKDTYILHVHVCGYGGI